MLQLLDCFFKPVNSPSINLLLLLHLSINNCLDLLKRHRFEIVVVHTYVVLGRIQILKPFGIDSRVVLSSVDVAEKLPYVFVTTYETQERIVA